MAGFIFIMSLLFILMGAGFLFAWMVCLASTPETLPSLEEIAANAAKEPICTAVPPKKTAC